MVQSKNLKTVILSGPTAVGKTSVALNFVKLYNDSNPQAHSIEIINADSVCFYQYFNVGSAKPTQEELAQVPHHLIDIADPLENYHAGKFLKDCNRVLEEIHARGNRALIVGGSGFYLKALRFGLWDAPPTSPEFRATLEKEETGTLFQELLKKDPQHAQKIGAQDRYRIIRALEIIAISQKTPTELEESMQKEADPRFELWTLERDKEELAKRMSLRITQMLKAGLVEEVKLLRTQYPESKMLHAVGYQQVLNYLDGIAPPPGRVMSDGEKGLHEEIFLAHRQLAKQQRTWMKSLNPNQSFRLDAEADLLTEKLMDFYK